VLTPARKDYTAFLSNQSVKQVLQYCHLILNIPCVT